MELAKMFNYNFKNGDFRLYDENNNRIYVEYSNGFWEKREYDLNKNLIYFEDSGGYWYKKEYDSNNNRIYFETSNGKIIDNRPKCDKVVEIEGIKYKLVKI